MQKFGASFFFFWSLHTLTQNLEQVRFNKPTSHEKLSYWIKNI